MKFINFSLILFLWNQSYCYADVTHLSLDHRNLLEDSARFSESRTLMDLPHEVTVLIADDNGNIAEPGQEWRSTDVIGDPSIPSKRLIWTALWGEYYVIHYERGGRGHSYHIVVATFTQGQESAAPVWRAVGGPFEDYSVFLEALRNGGLDDNLKFGY
jgi:hypothetical protein